MQTINNNLVEEDRGEQIPLAIGIFIHTFIVLTVFLYSSSIKITELKRFILCYIAIVSTLSYFKACISDPGTVFRTREAKYKPNILFLGNNNLVNTCFIKQLPFNREIIVHGTMYNEKYCLECNIFKSSRTSHCYICDGCVIECDHHCPWINNCIGRNNKKYFLILIFSTTFCLYFCLRFLMNGYNIFNFQNITLHITFISLYSIIFVLFGLIFLIMVAFSVYHLYLLLYDIRSKEFLKGKVKKKHLDIKRTMMLICGENLSY